MLINIISFHVTTLMTPSAVRDVLCEPVRDSLSGARNGPVAATVPLVWRCRHGLVQLL